VVVSFSQSHDLLMPTLASSRATYQFQSQDRCDLKVSRATPTKQCCYIVNFNVPTQYISVQ